MKWHIGHDKVHAGIVIQVTTPKMIDDAVSVRYLERQRIFHFYLQKIVGGYGIPTAASILFQKERIVPMRQVKREYIVLRIGHIIIVPTGVEMLLIIIHGLLPVGERVFRRLLHIKCVIHVGASHNGAGNTQTR